MTVVANISSYTLRQPEKGAPFVVIYFTYHDEFTGVLREIGWLGSLSDKARKYTIERLKSIGLAGDLTSYNEIMAVINGTAGWVTEGITIRIEDHEYKGKKQKRVTSFYLRKELTKDEKIDLATRIVGYLSKPTTKQEAKDLPTRKKNVEVAQQINEHPQSKFNADEEIPDFSEPPKSKPGKPLPF